MDTNSIMKTYDGSQDGGDLAYFAGKQYGSGWLRTLGRFAFPIIKRVAKVAGNVAQDVLDNPDKPVLDSLRDNAVNEVARVVHSSINTGQKRKRGINPRHIALTRNNNKRQKR